MKKNELFEAWKLNQWFYSFWLFVCVCIMNKPITPILKRSAMRSFATNITSKWWDLPWFTALESFQKITLKILIHRDLCVFYVFKHLNMDSMESGVFWLHQCEMPPGSWQWKFGKARALLGSETPEVHWGIIYNPISRAKFFSGKSGTKKLQALNNLQKMMGWSFQLNPCFQWALKMMENDGKWWQKIRVSNGILWFQHFSISLRMDIQWMDPCLKRCKKPVWGWSLNDFVSTGITRWWYIRCIWGLLRVPSQNYRECTTDLLRWYAISPMEIRNKKQCLAFLTSRSLVFQNKPRGKVVQHGGVDSGGHIATEPQKWRNELWNSGSQWWNCSPDCTDICPLQINDWEIKSSSLPSFRSDPIFLPRNRYTIFFGYT